MGGGGESGGGKPLLYFFGFIFRGFLWDFKLEDSLAQTVKKARYSNVQRFIKTYQKSMVAIRQDEKEYAVYMESVEKGLVVDPEVKVSMRRQLREFQEEEKQQEHTSIQDILEEESL